MRNHIIKFGILIIFCCLPVCCGYCGVMIRNKVNKTIEISYNSVVNWTEEALSQAFNSAESVYGQHDEKAWRKFLDIVSPRNKSIHDLLDAYKQVFPNLSGQQLYDEEKVFVDTLITKQIETSNYVLEENNISAPVSLIKGCMQTCVPQCIGK